MRKVFNTYSIVYPVTFHMPVYIPVADTYRIGLQGVDNSSALVNDIGIVKGLWPGDIPPGAWLYPPVTALPSCSARWEGKGLTLLGASNDNHQHVCSNSASGYVWRQIG